MRWNCPGLDSFSLITYLNISRNQRRYFTLIVFMSLLFPSIYPFPIFLSHYNPSVVFGMQHSPAVSLTCPSIWCNFFSDLTDHIFSLKTILISALKVYTVATRKSSLDSSLVYTLRSSMNNKWFTFCWLLLNEYPGSVFLKTNTKIEVEKQDIGL